MSHQKVNLKPREVYGITGSKGHGKDTFAKLVLEASAAQRLARTNRVGTTFQIAHFAGALKRMASRIFGLTEAQMNDPVLKEALLESPVQMDLYLEGMRNETGLLDMQPAEKIATSPRTLMQYFGTEYVRKTQDDYWVQRLLGDTSNSRRVLVPDTRFLNESSALKSAGALIIKVLRIDTPENADSHASETEMNQIEPDLLIGVRTGDLSLPKRIANLIAIGKFEAAKRYDYRTAQKAISAYLAGRSLEESALLLGQQHKHPYALKNLLDYYQVPQRKQVRSRVGHQIHEGEVCKWCSRCVSWKPVILFNAASKSWDGLAGLCQLCAKEANKERYQKYSKVDSLDAILQAVEKQARYRGKEFGLTRDQVHELWQQQQGQCCYSGLPMTTELGHPNKITLDRIDSSKGYILGNVALCTYRVNLMKREMSVQEFSEIIDTLHHHLHKDEDGVSFAEMDRCLGE